MKTLLQGVVGSQAYGLAHDQSDTDRLGIFAASTLDVAGLRWGKSDETHATTEPDTTLHEVGKAFRLMLSGNPTVNELLWLDEYEVMDDWGSLLIEYRLDFLSTHSVKSAYGGYAHQQAARVINSDSHPIFGDRPQRRDKAVRHMVRVLRQGEELMRTGRLTVRVTDPDFYSHLSDLYNVELSELYRKERAAFNRAATNSVLPSEPDTASVKYLLRQIRAHNLN